MKYHPLTEKIIGKNRFGCDQTFVINERTDKIIREWLEEKAEKLCPSNPFSCSKEDMLKSIYKTLDLTEPTLANIPIIEVENCPKDKFYLVTESKLKELLNEE